MQPFTIMPCKTVRAEIFALAHAEACKIENIKVFGQEICGVFPATTAKLKMIRKT